MDDCGEVKRFFYGMCIAEKYLPRIIKYYQNFTGQELHYSIFA